MTNKSESKIAGELISQHIKNFENENGRLETLAKELLKVSKCIKDVGYSGGIGTCIECKICYPKNDESIKNYIKKFFRMIKTMFFN